VWLAVVVRPRIAQRPFRLLDAALLCSLALIAAQLAPLPSAIREALSPAAVAFDRRVRFTTAAAWRPLSGGPAAAAGALARAAGSMTTFWCARSAFARGGVRWTIRGVAWLGLAAAALAIVQHATAPTLFYWYWRPISPTARPYGPFANRNDLACWLIMALPLTAGYAIAR